jgi:hypothetical protein
MVTVDQLVQETNLAWALAEAAKPHLSTVERNDVFVTIGAGETFAAIRQLFKSVAMKRIPLRPDLVQRCTTWLRAYGGHEEERYLRHLIEDFVIPYAIRVAATVGVNQGAGHAKNPWASCAYQPLRHAVKAERMRLPDRQGRGNCSPTS